MSTEKITSQILEEAQNAKDEIISQAQQKCDSIKLDAEEMAKSIMDKAEVKGLEEYNKAIVRRKSVADIDGRKVILEMKQQVIKECFDEALERIIGLDESQYVDLLVSLGIKSEMNGGKLIFNKKEGPVIGKKVLDKLNSELNKSKTSQDSPGFFMDDECGNMLGGYIISGETSYADITVESLLSEYKTALASDISGILFPHR